MIKQVEKFLKAFGEKHGPFDRVLDIGSKDEGGVGTVRDFIPNHNTYVGLDMREGKNVDIVMNAHDIGKKWKRPSFDLVTCTDTLEHDDKFWVTISQMRRVLRPGGWLLITVPSLKHKFHPHPSDYWRFFETSMLEWLEGYEEIVTSIGCWSDGANDSMPDEILGYGRKPK